MPEELKVIASFDDKGVEAGLKKIGRAASEIQGDLNNATSNLKKFESALKVATNPKEIEFLSRSVTGLKQKLEVLNAEQNNLLKTQSSFTKGANQASQALINVGRVAQDSAFGFIGIANNLNPLLESFQRLQAETGSSALAMKALGNSLLGAGGIGLALSAVTAILQFSQLGFSAWTRGLDGGSDALSNLNLNLLEFVETTKTAKEQLDRFTKSSESDFKLFDEAVKQVFGNEFKGQIEGAEGKFISLREQIAATEKTLLVLEENSRKAFRALLDAGDDSKALQNLTSVFTDLSKIPEDVISKLSESQQQFVKASIAASKAVTEEQNKLKELNDSLTLQSSIIRTIQADEKRRQDDLAKKRAKEIADRDTIQKQLDKLNRSLQLIDLFGDVFGTDSATVAKEKIQAITSAVKTIAEKFKLAPDDTIIAKLLGNKAIANDLLQGLGNNLKALDLRTQVVKAVEDSVARTGPVDIIIPANVQLLIKNQKDFFIPLVDGITKQMEELRAKINSILSDTFSNIASEIANTIGAAIAGQAGGLGNIFSKFLDILSSGLAAIGKALVQYGIAKEIISKLKISGAAAIAVGIGLQVFAAALKNSLKLQAFAVGGVSSGGTFLAGERGPELITAPAGTRITPASQTASLLGSDQVLTGRLTANGKDLVILIDVSRKALNRQN